MACRSNTCREDLDPVAVRVLHKRNVAAQQGQGGRAKAARVRCRRQPPGAQVAAALFTRCLPVVALCISSSSSHCPARPASNRILPASGRFTHTMAAHLAPGQLPTAAQRPINYQLNVCPVSHRILPSSGRFTNSTPSSSNRLQASATLGTTKPMWPAIRGEGNKRRCRGIMHDDSGLGSQLRRPPVGAVDHQPDVTCIGAVAPAMLPHAITCRTTLPPAPAQTAARSQQGTSSSASSTSSS